MYYKDIKNFAVLGDIHLKNNDSQDKEYIDIVVDLLNSKKINNVILLGDIFDSPKITLDIVNSYYYILNKFIENNINVFILVGNHDLVKSSTFENIYKNLYIPNNVKIIDKITVIDNNKLFLPYNTKYKEEFIDEIINKINNISDDKIYIFSHNDFHELYYSAKIDVKHNLPSILNDIIKNIDYSNKEIIFISGHIHKTSFIKIEKYNLKLYNIGCMLNKSYSDKNINNVVLLKYNNDIEIVKTYFNDIYYTTKIIKNLEDFKNEISKICIYPNLKHIKFLISSNAEFEIDNYITQKFLKAFRIKSYSIEYVFSYIYSNVSDNITTNTELFDISTSLDVLDSTTSFLDALTEYAIIHNIVDNVDKINELLIKYEVE